jgi:hypothetical protein
MNIAIIVLLAINLVCTVLLGVLVFCMSAWVNAGSLSLHNLICRHYEGIKRGLIDPTDLTMDLDEFCDVINRDLD